METIKTKDRRVLEYITPLVDKYITEYGVDEYDSDNFVRLLDKIIDDKGCGIFISYDKDDIHGHAIALFMSTMSYKFISILQFFGDSEEVEECLMDEIKKWAIKNKIYRITSMITRPKKFKKLGFRVVKHAVELNMEEENKELFEKDE